MLDNENIACKVIELCVVNEINESKLYLKMLDNQIKFYQNELNFLEDNKPFFFQKKKLEEHNKKIEEYEQKIFDTYKKIEKEIDFMYEMQQSIDNMSNDM